jgi:hypothetical protein
LKKDLRVRVVVEEGLREGKDDFRDRMQKAGLEIVDEGVG